MQSLFPIRLLTCAMALGAAPFARAQCNPQWLADGGPSGSVLALASWDQDGAGPLPAKLVVGGTFVTAGGVTVNRIATYDLQTGAWAALGAGVGAGTPPFSTDKVNSIVVGAGNTLYIGGKFNGSGGLLVPNCAYWDGSAWSPVGLPVWAPASLGVLQMLLMPNGDLIAAGNTIPALQRWDGSAWSSIGYPVAWGNPLALVLDANGDLLVGSGIAGVGRWNGTTWSILGSGATGVSGVVALARLPNGDIVAGGTFTSLGGVSASNLARWDGTSWAPLGAGVNSGVQALAVLPNGDLVVGGDFTQAGGAPANRLARWDGTSWSALGSGVDNTVRAFGTLAGGQLAIGGNFAMAGGVACQRLARYASTCVATQAGGGGGCAGSGGPNVLTALTGAWIGGDFVARATGLPSTGNVLAVGVYGFSATSIPLASFAPQGLPGCVLHATDDIPLAYSPVAGVVDTSVPVPNSVLLAGQSFHHQVLSIELDAANVITAISATNALVLTVGAF